jgi:hypothetical protein
MIFVGTLAGRFMRISGPDGKASATVGQEDAFETLLVSEWIQRSACCTSNGSHGSSAEAENTGL